MASMLKTAEKWIWNDFGEKQKKRAKNSALPKNVDNQILDMSFLQFFPLSIQLANLYDQHTEASDGTAELVLKAIQKMFFHMHYRFVGSTEFRNNADVAAVIHLRGMPSKGEHIHNKREIPGGKPNEPGSSPLWQVKAPLTVADVFPAGVLSLHRCELSGNSYRVLYPIEDGTCLDKLLGGSTNKRAVGGKILV